jgi:hypothetical protein
MRLPWGLLLLLALPLLALLCGVAPAPAAGVELCGPEAQTLMRSVGIAQAQIDALCAKVARAAAPLTLALVRTRDELGYCRVTLALTNNSTLHLNVLVLTVEDARFHPFRFLNVLPGGTGHASANSRVLLACDELPELKLVFHWPASLRIGDRSPTGQQLAHYRPQLLDPVLEWSR